MSHVGVRLVFALGAVLTAVVLAGAGLVAMLPANVPPLAPRDIAVAKASALRDGVAREVDVKELAGLESKARELRAAGPYRPMAPPHVDTLPVYLVRSDGVIRGFIGLDPRNGCRLAARTVTTQPNVTATVFDDVCHGSLYDLAGDRFGGPSPWTLDELVVSVRDDLVYIDRRAVMPGHIVQ